MQQVTNPARFDIDPGGWAWCASLSRCLVAIDQKIRLGAADDLVTQTRRLVDGAVNETWSLNTLAARLGVSERSLTRQARHQTSMSVMQWVRHRRMQLAEAMLANGMTVTDVAEILQASSPYSFSRCFKQVMGLAPSEVTRLA